MLSERAATLRAAGQRGYSKEELEVRERVRLKIEEENRKKQRVPHSNRRLTVAVWLKIISCQKLS